MIGQFKLCEPTISNHDSNCLIYIFKGVISVQQTFLIPTTMAKNAAWRPSRPRQHARQVHARLRTTCSHLSRRNVTACTTMRLATLNVRPPFRTALAVPISTTSRWQSSAPPKMQSTNTISKIATDNAAIFIWNLSTTQLEVSKRLTNEGAALGRSSAKCDTMRYYAILCDLLQFDGYVHLMCTIYTSSFNVIYSS